MPNEPGLRAFCCILILLGELITVPMVIYYGIRYEQKVHSFTNGTCLIRGCKSAQRLGVVIYDVCFSSDNALQFCNDVYVEDTCKQSINSTIICIAGSKSDIYFYMPYIDDAKLILLGTFAILFTTIILIAICFISINCCLCGDEIDRQNDGLPAYEMQTTSPLAYEKGINCNTN